MRERVRRPRLPTGAFTYLLPSDEKEVRRNWHFKKEKRSPHLEALSVPFFASPDPPALEVWKELAGVCFGKLAVEKVPQKDLLWREILLY